MNKKKNLMITLAITTALAVPFSVFAASSDSPTAKSIRGLFGVDATKLTDTQKSDIDQYVKQAAQLQKDFINKMVENGTLTREQGDAEIKKIDDRLNNGDTSGFLPGFGFQQGFKGKGGFDKGGFVQGKIDTSKLTDAQKATLNEIYKKMADLQKSQIQQMVSNGLLTKEQGDACTKKLDEITNGTQKAGISDGLKMFNVFGGFNFFNIRGLDASKLTDQQKADMKATADQMLQLQKDIINNLVSFGVMTQDQANAALSRLDAMSSMDMPGKFQGDFDRHDMKGRMDGPRGGMNRTQPGSIAPGTGSDKAGSGSTGSGTASPTSVKS